MDYYFYIYDFSPDIPIFYSLSHILEYMNSNGGQWQPSDVESNFKFFSGYGWIQNEYYDSFVSYITSLNVQDPDPELDMEPDPDPEPIIVQSPDVVVTVSGSDYSDTLDDIDSKLGSVNAASEEAAATLTDVNNSLLLLNDSFSFFSILVISLLAIIVLRGIATKIKESCL